MLQDESGDLELLLPWHAAGALNPRDAHRVDEALARDRELARHYAVIREEYAETIALNEGLGAPSARALQRLFAAIDAEPARQPAAPGLAARILGFFENLSPSTLAWSASVGALLLLLQAGVIGSMLLDNHPAAYRTASSSTNQFVAPRPGTAPPRALVRFVPDARVADITALLGKYHASIIGGVRDGFFRLQFGGRAMSDDDAASLMKKLRSEKILSLAVPTP
jgi:anti-sigma factor RsiW